jgi:hypothetical protein
MERSEPELSESPLSLSREGSFFSLTSGNSAYVTAPESLGSERVGDAEGPSRDRRHSSTSTNSSTTLGESLGSEEARDDRSSGSIPSSEIETNGNGEEETESSSHQDTPFEVKQDVSRICNDIAEAIQPDTKKKAEINLAIAGKSLDSLRKLAVSDGGLLSSESISPLLHDS